jgi:two-component system phosphate regulon response regulator PhoB
MPRILVVEDNASFAYGLRINLELEGYEVVVAEDGLAALEELKRTEVDVVILDLLIPRLNGLDLLRSRHELGLTDARVLVLSALGEEHDRVRGLDLGADDYLPKTCGVTELLARVRALLRRSRALTPAAGDVAAAFERYDTVLPTAPSDDVHRFGDCVVDLAGCRVFVGGIETYFTPLEFNLLSVFLRNPRRVLSRAELLAEVWGTKALLDTRTVDNHVGSLRRKLGDDGHRPRHIIAVRKRGYRFDP